MQTLFAGQARSIKWASLCVLTVLAGCGEKGPPAIPVQGKVVFEKGGSVLPLYDTQAGVLFESVDSPGVQSYGAIQEDGSFKLMTSVDGAPAEGAVAGNYRGRLVMDDEVKKLVAPKFLDAEKSGIKLTVPVQGEVVIKIGR